MIAVLECTRTLGPVCPYQQRPWYSAAQLHGHLVGARAVVGEEVLNLRREILRGQPRARGAGDERQRHEARVEEADRPLTSA